MAKVCHVAKVISVAVKRPWRDCTCIRKAKLLSCIGISVARGGALHICAARAEGVRVNATLGNLGAMELFVARSAFYGSSRCYLCGCARFLMLRLFAISKRGEREENGNEGDGDHLPACMTDLLLCAGAMH